MGIAREGVGTFWEAFPGERGSVGIRAHVDPERGRGLRNPNSQKIATFLSKLDPGARKKMWLLTSSKEDPGPAPVVREVAQDQGIS